MPNNIKRTRFLIAVSLFAGIFALSQDYWSWRDPLVAWWLGLPRWVYLFAALQLGVSAIVAWYTRRDMTDS